MQAVIALTSMTCTLNIQVTCNHCIIHIYNVMQAIIALSCTDAKGFVYNMINYFKQHCFNISNEHK